jgi:hypothetical protein
MTNKLEPPYNFHDLRKRRESEVIDEINRQFDQFKNDITGDKPLHALNAQFLMQELARRDQRWQAHHDPLHSFVTIMTVAITAMTAIQLCLAWRTPGGH